MVGWPYSLADPGTKTVTMDVCATRLHHTFSEFPGTAYISVKMVSIAS